MDLYAYTQIVDLQAIADRNGISVPRCRGYRLMKNEERVTTAEIEQMITEQALYEAEKLFVSIPQACSMNTQTVQRHGHADTSSSGRTKMALMSRWLSAGIVSTASGAMRSNVFSSR